MEKLALARIHLEEEPERVGDIFSSRVCPSTTQCLNKAGNSALIWIV